MKCGDKMTASRTRRAFFCAAGFTLIELLVALALMAVMIPVLLHGLRIATLAGEVSQRKSLAVRVADRVLNDAIISGPTQAGQSGDEKIGSFDFHWTLKDEAWNQLSGLSTSSTPNGVNQGVVNQNLIHQLSVDVNYLAQGQSFSVHLSTLYNTTPQ
jgi:type II secretion system protein I